MDRIDAVRSVIEVAKTGSFTLAANNLGLNRVKVSRHIQEVEHWLQVRLFHRTTRQVSLTGQGEEALSHCILLAKQAETLENYAYAQKKELEGKLRVAAPIGLGQELLLDLITAFLEQHPKVRIELLLSDHNADLVDERVDLAIRHTVQPDDALIARKLMQVDWVVCCSPGYISRYGQPDTPDDLAHHFCITHKAHQLWKLQQSGKTVSIKVEGRFCANDVPSLLRATVRGVGIALLPCDVANTYLKTGQITQVLPDYKPPESATWAVYLSRTYQQPVIRAFIDYIAEALAGRAQDFSLCL